MPTIVKEGINPRKQQVLVNEAYTFTLDVYENNVMIIPGSATIDVYKPNSTELFISSGVMSVGSNGSLTFALSGANNAALGLNYKAVVSYVHGGVTRKAVLYYDVVRSLLLKVITDDDLVAEFSQLKDSGAVVYGAASSGSTTTIVDPALKRYRDDYFTGGLVKSLDKNEERRITGFAASTGTVTTEAFSSAFTTDRYCLMRSFYSEIQRAFEKIEERLRGLGRRAELVLDSYDLREVHIYYSVAEAAKGLSTAQGDFWWSVWMEYERKADELFRSTGFSYDLTGDGLMSGGESGGFSAIEAVRG